MITSLHNRHGERLDFTFHPGAGGDCLVILGHGVTGNKDRPLLVRLAGELVARGWPCLRLSFSGNGGSGGEFAASTITKEIADLQAVLDALPAGIRVAYLGHSMGGAVGLLTAVRDERIRVLVSLAGMVFPAEFYHREFGAVVVGEGCMWDEPSCPVSQAFADDMTGHGDLLDAAAAVVVPWLLLHGSADDVVPPADSEAANRTAVVEPRKLVRIDGAGHAFDEAAYPLLVEEIDAWLRDHLADTKSEGSRTGPGVTT